MPWFQVEDNLAFHPKVQRAGNSAMGLWVRAGSWSMQNLTDGCIPHDIAAFLGSSKDAARLVDVGLWYQKDDGYEFHDWLVRQRSRGKVEADREAAKQRRKKAAEKAQKMREQLGLGANDEE